MPLAFPAPALGWTDETDEQYAQSPIDPTGPVAFAIDPAILNEENETVEYAQELEYQSQHQVQQPSATEQVEDYLPDHDQHSQQDHYARDFPQGLPPEPELLLQMPHDDDEQPPPPRASQKKVRRVKRPRREKDCGFCQGNDERNKEGFPETMLSCFNCGRSGHPTCLDIAGIAETVFNYPWTCIECKACEICHGKGDDTKLLFCDNCDRGWHYDCLDPPLDGTPDGNWNCPLCPPLPEEECNYEGEEEADEGEAEASGGEAEDDAAALTEGEAIVQVASTPRPKKKKGKTKSKSRPSITYRTPSSIKKTRLPQHGPGRPIGSGNKSSAIPSQQRVTFRLRLGSGRSSKGVVDDEKTSPFEGFLDPEEYDASKTVITTDDKNRFEKSRIAAEVLLAISNLSDMIQVLTTVFPLDMDTLQNKTLARTVQSSLPEAPGSSSTLPPSSSLRPLRSLSHLIPPPTPALTESPAPSTPGPAGSNDGTGQLRIRTLRFGEWDIDTWYDAPFPEEYNNLPEGRLWMCEFCLRYMRSGFGWERHQTKCKARHPPGDEIYRDGDISVFEVDGRKNKIYCQNLCLLSKMFLDHKSLFYDVEPFLFYVMTEIDDGGAHFVGYFSKEKRSPKDFNVSCIMTLPVRQRKGWGNLLIDFSYLLSKKEQRVGSPERPLSALGALSYRNYWTLAVMNYLQTAPEHVTFESISAATSMTITDIVTTLREQNMLIADERPHSPLPRSPAGIKGGKNKHSRTRPRSQLFSNSRRNSSRKVTSTKEDNNSEPRIPSPGSYTIQWDQAEVEGYLVRWHAKGYLTLKPNRLKWSPYLLTRGGLMLKSDSAPSQVVGADDIIDSPIPKLFPGDAESKAASEAGISAVEQVASTGHAEAGPSRTSADSPSTSKHSPHVTIDVYPENDQDSTFEPEVLEETPTRTRSRSASRQQPTRVSLRQLTSRTGSLTSDARSSVTSDRRRTRAQEREHRQNDVSLMNGQPLIAADHGEKRSTGRHGRRRSLENLRSPRKRSRIASSPESSLLSEPPSSYAHHTSSPPTEDEDDDKGLSNPSHYVMNQNGDGLRRTRSFMSRGNPRSNKRTPTRRTSLRLNNGHGDELGNHSPYFTPFFDDPEEALRNAKKARLNQAISLQVSSVSPAALSPVTNGVNGVNTNGNAIVLTPVPMHMNPDIDESDLLDADAEGEVEEAIGLLPIDPSEEGDMDAEGEVEDAEGDADAEGEIEEMELY